jgi:glycosyltransferase involved in cell wall biosynthesis
MMPGPTNPDQSAGGKEPPNARDAGRAGRAPISVCIVCRNEADKLEPALASVQWTDEILLLDLESEDGSAALAERYGARVIRRERVPIVELVRNEIAAYAAHDWILVLDPDERVMPGLANELRTVAARDEIDAVILPRMNRDFGHDPSSPLQRYEGQLRMYRRSRVEWPTVPNALPVVPEQRLYRVPARDDLVLLHERSRNIPEVLERSIRYAPIQAQSMIDRGQVFSARAMFSALSAQTARHVFKGRAFHDGVPGFLRASTLVLFHYYVWACFWQLSGGKRTRADDRFMRRIGALLETVRRSGRLASAPVRLLKRLLRSRR